MTITFRVPCVPVAQPRQRHAIIAGHVRNYMPAKHPVNAFKAAVQVALQGEFTAAPLMGPLVVRLVFVFPRPTNKTWKNKPMPRYPHVKRGDADNLAKAVLDSLNKLAFYDDAQVYDLHVEKWIASGDEQPGVEVEITEVTDA